MLAIFIDDRSFTVPYIVCEGAKEYSTAQISLAAIAVLLVLDPVALVAAAIRQCTCAVTVPLLILDLAVVVTSIRVL